MIHQTAVVDSKAEIGQGVDIGAFCVIGPDVKIGNNTEIKHHSIIEGPTNIGERCRIFPFTSIGFEPQDKKYHGENSLLEIGDDNTIREYVTINRGTDLGGGVTRLGNHGWIMAYCHIAHDCIVGDHVTMANHATLGGHVTIKDYATIGGLTGIHQFCKVGEYSMTGAQSLITQDVVPFSIVTGNRAKMAGVNLVGLDRNGFSSTDIDRINQAYTIFFKKGLTRDAAIEKLRETFPDSPHISMFIDFIQSSERGVCR